MPQKLDAKREAEIREQFPSYPFPMLLGMQIDMLEYGQARLRLPYGQDITQGMGYIHGGVIGALCDTSVAIALFTMLEKDQKILTVEFKINFIAPADKEVRSVARIIHKGRRTAVGDVEVMSCDGVLVAKGLVTYYIIEE